MREIYKKSVFLLSLLFSYRSYETFGFLTSSFCTSYVTFDGWANELG